MANSLKYFILFSLSCFLLLELGFFLEGFLQTCLFSIVLIVYFFMLIFIYGAFKDKKLEKKIKRFYLLLMILPLISLILNPTKYLQHYHNENEVVLRGTNFAKLSLIQNTSTLYLYSDSTFRLKEFGFWMNTNKNGDYYISKKILVLKYNKQFVKYKLKKHYENYRLYRVKGAKKLDYFTYYELDKIGDTFVEKLRPIKKSTSN
ncbi:MAG: hypothetical protein HYU67_10840 [Flavobacteriia bacterium]|nr:hypothetical protein [Flavobacteriia bacterium]